MNSIKNIIINNNMRKILKKKLKRKKVVENISENLSLERRAEKVLAGLSKKQRRKVRGEFGL